VYLLLGTDRPKVGRALARLRARFPAESVTVLATESATGADAVAACNSLGLFGEEGAQLVVVEGVERWRADDVDAVVAYLGDPAPAGVLALVAEGALRNDALVRACERAGDVLRFDVPKPRDPSVWVRAEFERLGARVDADAARALVDIVGGDALDLAAEIEKLATWAGEEPISRRDVEALAVGSGETFVWALTDAWGSRDVAAVLRACEALLAQGKDPFGIAIALASYVSRVRAAEALADEGLATAEVAKRLRIKDYPARKALEHAKRYSREELDDAVVRLAELDAGLKGASRLAGELELERALVDVTRTREPVEAS
jgi:DNA polymerase-3 subunit delta